MKRGSGPEPLFELEAVIMGVVWKHAPVSARDVCGRLRGKRERAYTTVMTTMDRLYKKGLLAREKVGLAWVYNPTMTEIAFEKALADRLAIEIIGAHGDVGLAAVVDAASTDDGTLRRLEILIAAKKRSGR
jgi:predicted transcriptional regulator